MTLDILTDRQREVAQLVAEGLTNKAIAARLGIHTSTVYKFVNRIAIVLDATKGDTRVLITRRVLACAA